MLLPHDAIVRQRRGKRKKIEKPVQIDINCREIKLLITTNNLKEIDYATNF